MVHRGSVLLDQKVLRQRDIHRWVMRIGIERAAQQLQAPLHRRGVRLRGSLHLLLDGSRVGVFVAAVEQGLGHGRKLVELALR